jgi:hypothetical protein
LKDSRLFDEDDYLKGAKLILYTEHRESRPARELREITMKSCTNVMVHISGRKVRVA